MAELKSQRITRLSTRYLSFYKNSVLLILICIIGFLLFGLVVSFLESGFDFFVLYQIGLFGYLIYLWIRMNRNVHKVEFDNDFLYVIQHNQDIIIPLENVKEVDIKTLGGVYEVELFTAEQLGKKFYFKPSLLYPFNYKQKDELVNILRRNINRALARNHHYQANTLHS